MKNYRVYIKYDGHDSYMFINLTAYEAFKIAIPFIIEGREVHITHE